jgi:ligand-binding sensor domain-containing protein
LSHFDGTTFQNVRKEDGLPNNNIGSLCLQSNGALWLGSENGVVRFDPEAPPGHQVRRYTATDGLIPGEVWSLCQGPDGTMWFAGQTGLSKFDGQKFVTFPKTNLLSEGVEDGLTRSKDGYCGLPHLVV